MDIVFVLIYFTQNKQAIYLIDRQKKENAYLPKFVCSVIS